MVDERPNVFISRKEADEAIAKRIVGFIRGLTGGAVGVYNMGDSRTGLKPGENIRDSLASKLRYAEMVALVYSRPDDDWSYCMWECGVAMGSGDKQDKTILVLQCLEGSEPSVFDGEVVVQLWNLNDVKAFAKMFKEQGMFSSLGGPATKLDSEELDEHATRLHAELAPLLRRQRAKPIAMHPTVHVETAAPDPQSGESEPGLARIEADVWSSRVLFGLPEITETSWATIREQLRNQNEELVRELVERARDYRKTGKVPEPLTAPFINDGGTAYDPLMTSVTSLEDEAVGYNLVFVRRDVDYDGDIPDDVVEMFATRPVEEGMEPFNTRVQLLESSSWRLTWYLPSEVSEVLVSDMVEFYLAKSVNRYRGRATVTHRYPWDDDMDFYAVEGQASSTGEFIFTFWNLYGASLLGACALKKTTSGRIYTGDWIGFSGESEAVDVSMMQGRLRMCTHTDSLEELRRARADFEAARDSGAGSVDEDLVRRAEERVDVLTGRASSECEDCVRLQGSLLAGTSSGATEA